MGLFLLFLDPEGNNEMILSKIGFWERVALQPHCSSPNFSRAFQFFSVQALRACTEEIEKRG